MVIMNGLEVYEDCGRRAAKARNDGDEARAKFEDQHYRKMRALEPAGYRRQADQAYNSGYIAARNARR
jgi:hypothetical protein